MDCRWQLHREINLSALNDGGTRNVRASMIWKLGISLKVRVFAWLVLKKKTPTMNNLLKRGWTGSTNCVLCGVEEETRRGNHRYLFTQCVASKFLIVTTLERFQSGDLRDDVRCIWDKWVIMNRSQPIRTIITSLAAYWRVI